MNCKLGRLVGLEHERAVCPECDSVMPITAEHNGIAWVGHGVCPVCGWASQHPLPDEPNSHADGSRARDTVGRVVGSSGA